MRPRDVTTAPTPLVAVEASGSPAMRNRYIGRCTEVLDLLPGVASLATDALEVPGDLARLGRAISALSDRLVREKEREAMLSSVSDRVLQGVLLHEVLDHIYESFRTLIPYDRIGCALLEDDGQVLRAQWARSEFVQSRLPQGYAARMEGSSLRSLVDIGTPRIIDDLEAYAAVRPRSHATRLILEEGVRSSLTCPTHLARASGGVPLLQQPTEEQLLPRTQRGVPAARGPPVGGRRAERHVRSARCLQLRTTVGTGGASATGDP